MRPIHLPDPIAAALQEGAALAVSISGGKDSQAMTNALVRLHRAHAWPGAIFAIHADLGRIEWPQTPAHVATIARTNGLPLQVVRRRDGVGEWDMIARWRQRAETLKAQGKAPRPWSDAKNRFCTSEMKRDPINGALRRYAHIISAEGIRAQESKARAAKAAYHVRDRLWTQTRRAWTWNPLLDWTLDDVWEACGTSAHDLETRQDMYRNGETASALDGWPAHPAYVLGNQRLSCMFCILGCTNDLANAAHHNPALLQELITMEETYAFTFQQGKSLARFAETSRPATAQQLSFL